MPVDLLASTNRIVNNYIWLQMFCSKNLKKIYVGTQRHKESHFYGVKPLDGVFGPIYGVKQLEQGHKVCWPQTDSIRTPVHWQDWVGDDP